MRTHWKLASLLVVGVATFAALKLGTNEVAGDTPDPSSAQSSDQPGPVADEADDQLVPRLGPHTIPYEEQASAEQGNLDRMAERTFLSQGDVQAATRGIEQEVARTRAEIASRSVGLTGTDEQGVIP